MKIHVLGQDGVGWSIDRDREHTVRALEVSGHDVVRTPLRADVVYCVWWNLLEAPRWRPLRWKRVAAVVTNDLSRQPESLARLRRVIDVWVVANSGQRRFLEEQGVSTDAISDCPFYVEEDVFTSVSAPRAGLAALAGVDPERVEGRFLIGSFQRDSLGADLARPKWQKNPDLLLDVLEPFGSGGILLVLAGPRRHYVVAECRRRGIPYLFVGDEPDPAAARDDIDRNTLSLKRIAALWNLIDLYVVPSVAEGGPKALLEGGLTGTPVISTPVGMAPDLVPKRLLFRDQAEGTALVRRIMDGCEVEGFRDFVERVREVNRFEAFRERVAAAVAAAAGAGGPTKRRRAGFYGSNSAS